ncbi:DUF4326 domain-containing protein [Paraburkholderia sp. UCT31]|uniref:DUF4326 domain-containing protein n=1 Tax=Paraburkholderia sp. UCT31 TaxID=2615209 RepID=UPI00165614AC|nr:DUF4326 domain-containing protein [Paraburkholderia sp. UCT31]MBC8737330.1 DUF4326 domain-containing protein [Paraburkholderia sp. UCT31]
MSKLTSVVHCREAEYDVYIGRAMPGLPGSIFANPFRIGKDGTRDEVVEKHRVWLPTQPGIMARLEELRGLRLGCWCKGRKTPSARCHGDNYVLVLHPEVSPPVTSAPASQMSLF